MVRWIALVSLTAHLFTLASSAAFADKQAFTPPQMTVPDGYTVELVAGPPLVGHPVMACFDEQGRLFVAETAGKNLKRADLEKELPNFIRMLEDTDGDGKFDKSTIFADKLTFPQGVLPYNGAVYTCSSGALWKLVDTDGDNVADQRTKLVGDFGYTGNAADIHGPFLGPDGRLYWCEGRHGHEIKDKAGKIISKGKAARIFSCKLDGSDVQTFCGGGMDNPVEIVFTSNFGILGTCNLFYGKPRGDTLVHWVPGGVYPRYDFIDKLGGEFIHTGPALKEVHNFGHVAVSGLCRYRSEHFGPNRSFEYSFEDPDEPHILFITQFNTNKVVRTEVGYHGTTYRVTSNEDFLTSTSKAFHPTDVLEDADGSLLVVDTGGWFRIGCPVSQVAKPNVKGAIYRIRKVGGKKYEDPRGLKLKWGITDDDSYLEIVYRLSDRRFAVAERAHFELIRAFKKRDANRTPSKADPKWTRLVASKLKNKEPYERMLPIRALLAEPHPAAVPHLLEALALRDADAVLRHLIIHTLITIGDADAVAKGLGSDNGHIRNGAAIALAGIRRKQQMTHGELFELPAPAEAQTLADEQKAAVTLSDKSLPDGNVANGKVVFVSKKAGCVTCHRVDQAGDQLGPDLSTVGRIRSRRDLFESIVHPSASYARGYEPYVIETDDETLAGIIVGETSKQLHVATGKGVVQRVDKTAITEVRASKVSIMPAGMDKALSKQEMADLLAYLLSLKGGG